jgi:DNA-binding NarL/FixJ family response regulator
MSIVQIEFRTSLMTVREEILQSLGHPVVSALGSNPAKALDLSAETVGVISIGHGAPWQERLELIRYFKQRLPTVPVVVLLRQRDNQFSEADYNCPADNPPQWVRLIIQALQRA